MVPAPKLVIVPQPGLKTARVELLMLDRSRIRLWPGRERAESAAALPRAKARVVSAPASHRVPRRLGKISLPSERGERTFQLEDVVKARGALAVSIVIDRAGAGGQRQPARLAMFFLIGFEREDPPAVGAGIEHQLQMRGVEHEAAVGFAESFAFPVIVVAVIAQPPVVPST